MQTNTAPTQDIQPASNSSNNQIKKKSKKLIIAILIISSICVLSLIIGMAVLVHYTRRTSSSSANASQSTSSNDNNTAEIDNNNELTNATSAPTKYPTHSNTPPLSNNFKSNLLPISLHPANSMEAYDSTDDPIWHVFNNVSKVIVTNGQMTVYIMEYNKANLDILQNQLPPKVGIPAAEERDINAALGAWKQNRYDIWSVSGESNAFNIKHSISVVYDMYFGDKPSLANIDPSFKVASNPQVPEAYESFIVLLSTTEFDGQYNEDEVSQIIDNFYQTTPSDFADFKSLLNTIQYTGQ